MENLNIEKFNPLKAEVVNLVENCKNTTISLPNDKTGLELMKENKGLLQKKRKFVVDTMKDERSWATDYRNKVIEFEKELLAIIEPVEASLKESINIIEEEEARAKRIDSLPARHGMLKEIELVVEDDVLLGMDDKDFIKFLLEKKSEYLQAKEQAMREAQEEADRLNRESEARIAEKQRQLEEDARVLEAQRLASIEAQKQAKRDAEIAKLKADEDRIKAVAEVEAQAARDRQAIINENNRIENERLAKEQRDRDNIEAQRLADEKAKQVMESKKKYQKFLADNKYNVETDYILQSVDRVILARKVAEFIK
jgi:hypothetical protein